MQVPCPMWRSHIRHKMGLRKSQAIEGLGGASKRMRSKSFRTQENSEGIVGELCCVS
jgi:hypothetical protein